MGGIFNKFDKNGNKDLILPTVLKVSKDEIDYWTNMTCFYDKYWSFDPKLSTVPISFFHITSIAETIIAQGAEKRVILYEAPSTADKTANPFDPVAASHPAYRSNIEVIMNNVVVHPKQYQMEVIVPDSLIGPYQHQGLNRLAGLLEYLERSDNGSDLLTSIGNTMRNAQVFLETVQKATDMLDTVVGTVGVGSSQMSTMNKNSLEAMASKGRVVVFKKWTGYDYSYGIITKVDISKRPNEEGVYRGSISFQETPILNITTKNSLSTGGLVDSIQNSISYYTSQTARLLNLGLAYPFVAMTGVMDEAGAPGSKTADGGNSWDIFKGGA